MRGGLANDGAVAMMDHPQPPIGLADPHAGLVGGQRVPAISRALIKCRLERYPNGLNRLGDSRIG